MLVLPCAAYAGKTWYYHSASMQELLCVSSQLHPCILAHLHTCSIRNLAAQGLSLAAGIFGIQALALRAVAGFGGATCFRQDGDAEY
ncbi:hypothetical protein D3C81_2172290 [compost metagenome]